MCGRIVRNLTLCSCLALLTWGTLGCGDLSCEDGSSSCGDYSVCCTDTQCYYEVDDGTRFECDGTDCASAAQELAEYQCADLKEEAPEDFARLVEQILAAAQEQASAARTDQ